MRSPICPLHDNHYVTLEVSSTACSRVIQAAYRCLVQIHHPDKHAGSPAASELSARINKAYSVLSDAKKRSAYDEAMRERIPVPAHRSVHVDSTNVFRPFGFRPM